MIYIGKRGLSPLGRVLGVLQEDGGVGSSDETIGVREETSELSCVFNKCILTSSSGGNGNSMVDIQKEKPDGEQIMRE